MGRRVVVVDDDREIRDAVKERLTSEGYDVTVVPNGLRLLAALQIDKPDLVVLDVMMSWIDGFELCRAMKRNADWQDIPVLFISGKSAPADIERGLRCGAAAYLTKPFELSTLVGKIDEIVRRGPASPPAS